MAELWFAQDLVSISRQPVARDSIWKDIICADPGDTDNLIYKKLQVWFL